MAQRTLYNKMICLVLSRILILFGLQQTWPKIYHNINYKIYVFVKSKKCFFFSKKKCICQIKKCICQIKCGSYVPEIHQCSSQNSQAHTSTANPILKDVEALYKHTLRSLKHIKAYDIGSFFWKCLTKVVK